MRVLFRTPLALLLPRNALPRCALTFKGENVDTGLVSPLALFYINSPFLFAATFCPLLYASCCVDYRSRRGKRDAGIHVH